MSDFDNEMTDEQLAALLRDVEAESDAEEASAAKAEDAAAEQTQDSDAQSGADTSDLSEADRKVLEGLPTEDDVREQIRGLEGKWYVLHTYSGYEKRVKQDVETRIETMDMEDEIFQVEVPMEEVFEIRRGQRKLVSRVRMPGYVLVRMHLNDDSWRVVQSTNGVTGFVGNGRNPVALREDEVVSMLTPVIQADAAATAKAAGKPTGAEPATISPYEVGDSVTLISEPWAGMPATVSEVDPANQRLTVLMTLVGQETPVELSFTQVRKED
ncbi:MAG: transcription termination/antitermination factor NusG [Actinomycetaceae bacterium]|nr:transcription termination/antitermination factor NusG [Actinomycetaceae bacterium]